jgi:putative membrane protein (TIGR04086 family)
VPTSPQLLAALNIGAAMLGVAAGGLSASLAALLLGAGLTVANVDSGADIGLVVGIVIGLVVGGWTSGMRAKHSERFHGAITGLLMAFVIMVVAVLGGSPASTLSIIWLALLAIFISGLSGWLAGRWKLRDT